METGRAPAEDRGDGRRHELRPGAGILVTGATGYIGGRLVPRLLREGYRVRCLVRHPRKLDDRPWVSHPNVEVMQGDAADGEVLRAAMRDCAVAYYLIHSMIVAGGNYRQRDRSLAEAFAAAARASGLQRIIYLGGLGETGSDLSEHLESRREVEHALAGGDVPVTVLRAAMIMGSGSASFEILRYLVERLPVMVTPRWVETRCQPIAVREVLHYLVGCLTARDSVGRTIDIGGPDVLTYRELMDEMAQALQLKPRLVFAVPVLTPKLSALWIHLVTPIDRRIARPLAEGLKNPVLCRNDDAAIMMPGPRITVKEAIAEAVSRAKSQRYETVWSGAGPMPGDPEWAGGRVFVDRKDIEVSADADDAFRAICRIGGGHGWYAADGLWRIRGWMDRLVGGPGLRRLRRDPEQVSYGETLDFWRVTGIEPGAALDLRAEMKLPGEALLEFRIEPITSEAPESPESTAPMAQSGARGAEPARVRIVQTARFKPRGLLGLLYWYAVLPLHGFVFRGMLNGIKRSAESGTSGMARASAPEEGNSTELVGGGDDASASTHLAINVNIEAVQR